MHISVEAYGESRFNITYDPCKANIASMCPLNASNPITAFAVIPVSPNMVSGIPSIALGIPDLEGYARLQIFANSTQTEIGCFQAAMVNGNSFSQPQSVGALIGVFTFLAMLASFATAIYGVSITHMRTHFAHSFSVLVVFETFQSIFFSGALSVNWPSVLPAWWSNFAWTAGMFASSEMVHSISPFTGNSGNISQVGGAGSVAINNGGGLTQQIYGRALFVKPLLQRSLSPLLSLAPRAAYNPSNPYDYKWNGHPRTPGLPMPGTWPGFGGTLSAVDVPAAEAFILWLIWFVVVLGAVAFFIVFAKLVLDLFIKMKWIKTDGFDYFRSHLGGYLAAGLLRTFYIAFFSAMTLTMYQFSLRGPAGPTAIAAIVWIMVLGGLGGIAAFACYSRLRHGQYGRGKDSIVIEEGKLFKKIPFITATRASQIGEEETADKPRLFGTVPFIRIKYTSDDPNRATVHKDELYIKRFGWLSARYRRSRWWFFAFYLCYQFIRACFIGGGARTPLAQVYGLLIFEVLALLVIIKMNPFEGSRNTTMAVWLLSISKIVTTGLSIAFLPEFNLSRIAATVIGIVIVIVQGFLAVAVLVLIVLGIISSWMSLSRNREQFNPHLDQIRVKYFDHIKERAEDSKPSPVSRPQMMEPVAVPEPVQPHFEVSTVRRAPKIEDEDVDAIRVIASANGNRSVSETGRRSRANSASSQYSTSVLPRAARVHRASWSSKDFESMNLDNHGSEISRPSSTRPSSLRVQVLRARSNSTPISYTHRSPTPMGRPMTPALESVEHTALANTDSSEVKAQSSIAELDQKKDRGGSRFVESLGESTSGFTRSDNVESANDLNKH